MNESPSVRIKIVASACRGHAHHCSRRHGEKMPFCVMAEKRHRMLRAKCVVSSPSQPPIVQNDRRKIQTSLLAFSILTMSDEIDGTTAASRRRPFILLSGTPGVGKTATASLLAVSVVLSGVLSPDCHHNVGFFRLSINILCTHSLTPTPICIFAGTN